MRKIAAMVYIESEGLPISSKGRMRFQTQQMVTLVHTTKLLLITYPAPFFQRAEFRLGLSQNRSPAFADI